MVAIHVVYYMSILRRVMRIVKTGLWQKRGSTGLCVKTTGRGKLHCLTTHTHPEREVVGCFVHGMVVFWGRAGAGCGRGMRGHQLRVRWSRTVFGARSCPSHGRRNHENQQKFSASALQCRLNHRVALSTVSMLVGPVASSTAGWHPTSATKKGK